MHACCPVGGERRERENEGGRAGGRGKETHVDVFNQPTVLGGYLSKQLMS